MESGNLIKISSKNNNTRKRHLGFVNYFSEKGYGFLLTNNVGIDTCEQKEKAVEIFFHITDLQDKKSVTKSDLVTFEWQEQQDRDCPRARKVRILQATCEDYNLCREYLDVSPYINGDIRENNISKDISEAIYEFFASSTRGIDIVLNDFYKRKVNDVEDWQRFFSALKDKQNFKVDRNKVSLNFELALFFYKNLGDLSYLEDVNFVEKIVNYNEDTEHIFKNDEDFENWISSVLNKFICDDVILIKLFIKTYNLEIFSHIKNTSYFLLALLDNPEFLKRFLDKYKDNLEDCNVQKVLSFFNNYPEIYAEAIKNYDYDTQYQIVKSFPKPKDFHFVVQYLKESQIFDAYVEEAWENLKGNMPYIAFYLERNNDCISGYALYEGDSYKSYTSKDQIKTFIRKLNRQDLIIGHNIKYRDLKDLQKYGLNLKEGIFIWDTLEIEMLLNPCRRTYSLNSKHDLNKDVTLINKLFWNQLYRLSQDEKLLKSLKEKKFLPKSIDNLLLEVQKDYFASFFKKEGRISHPFVGEFEADNSVVKKLQELAKLKNKKDILVVAPKSLWPILANYLSLTFHKAQDVKYQSLNLEKIKAEPFKDILLQEILERFCTSSKTPIVGNLPYYLNLKEYISKEQDSSLQDDEFLANFLAFLDLKKTDNKNILNTDNKNILNTDFNINNDFTKVSLKENALSKYLYEYQGDIDCIDIDSFNDGEILAKDYKIVYFIGSELHGLFYKVKCADNKNIEELLKLGSSLPYKLSTSTQAPLDSIDLDILNIKDNANVDNIWAQRENTTEVSFYQNYIYEKYKENFLAHFSSKVFYIDWNIDPDFNHIYFVRAYDKGRESLQDCRVNNFSIQRAKYWVFQFDLICKINAENPSLPIVYIVNNDFEIEELKAYARELKFTVIDEDRGLRNLEYINNASKAIIILSKQIFLAEIGDCLSDVACCFIWDYLEIEQYQLMWENKLFLDAATNEDDAKYRNTIRQCIYKVLPLYKFYSSLVMTKKSDSRFFIIDSNFDDYFDFYDISGVSCCEVPFVSSSEYKYLIDIANKIFKEPIFTEKSCNQELAEGWIKANFIGGHDFRPVQKEVLSHMLKKEGDCIVSIPTGGGKSVLFQGPAIFRSLLSRKLSLVITPLKALMQDQVEELHKKGFFNVDYISSDREHFDKTYIYKKIRSGELSLLYITPERFRSKSFMGSLNARLEQDQGLEYIIFDEAHCISQWGNNFRPDYKFALKSAIDIQRNFGAIISMFSATVTAQVEQDIREYDPNLKRLGQSLDDYTPVRQHISISFEAISSQDFLRIERLKDFIIKSNIDFEQSSMMVFCNDRNKCEELSDKLINYCQGLSRRLNNLENNQKVLARCAQNIAFYHAGLDSEDRTFIYRRFRRDEGVEPIFILFATKAFGMGMDIPNVHYIIHFKPASTIEDYMQEVGRAGRNEDLYKKAFDQGKLNIPAICFYSQEDFDKTKTLTVKNLLSWVDLSEAKLKIINFIKELQSIENTKNNPICIPYNIWSKNDSLNATQARLAFYWLEKLGYIKTSFLGLVPFNIKFLEIDNDYISLNKVYEYCLNCRNKVNNFTFVDIRAMQKSLKKPIGYLIDKLIFAAADKKIELYNSFCLKLKARRYSETHYMIANNANIFALRIIFNGIEKLLSSCEIGKVKYIGVKEKHDFINHLLDGFNYELVYLKKDKNNEEDEDVRMPWYNKDIKIKGDVSKFNTFKRNILEHTGEQIFPLLAYIPKVICKIKQGKKDNSTFYQIVIQDNAWKADIKELENGCLSLLNYIVNHVKFSYSLVWSQLILNLGWQKKGFLYFNHILSILSRLGYTENSALLQGGVEVYTTDKSLSDIDEALSEDSALYPIRQEFELCNKLEIVRIISMKVLASLEGLRRSEFIKKYFKAKSYEDYVDVLQDYANEKDIQELLEQALKDEEKKFKDNEDQLNIYNSLPSENINVLAGPGSGKTHVLTMRCARLVYREHVDSSHILVLAYNRAVVVELKNRLNKLFFKLGMRNLGNNINVYTFSALTKKCMGARLEDIPTDRWEEEFYYYLKESEYEFKSLFPNIKYIMVDEFQDITEYRLNNLLALHHIFPEAHFFTIGDINQSIYGFDRVKLYDDKGRVISLSSHDYAKKLDPLPYYQKIREVLNPKEMTMYTNYRSYSQILSKAAEIIFEQNFIDKKNIDNLKKLDSYKFIKENDTGESHVIEVDNLKDKEHTWINDLPDIIRWSLEQNILSKEDSNEKIKKFKSINTIAVFFRTNNEVYRGFSLIKELKDNLQIPSNILIRIQGQSIGEIWRERELYWIVRLLSVNGTRKIKPDYDQQCWKNYIKEQMEKKPNWDRYMLDIGYILFASFIESIRGDNNSHYYYEIADYIKDVAGNDDGGQIYKIYENYQKEHILDINDKPLTIILTTMHKVKGLEFDVVIITPSDANLPLKSRHNYANMINNRHFIIASEDDDLADLDEERRLLFVAYTRAKKRLYIYKAQREHALENNQIYLKSESNIPNYTEKDPALDKYVLSFPAFCNYYSKTYFDEIKKGDPVEVCFAGGKAFVTHNGRIIGRLSSHSNILKEMQKNKIRNGFSALNGFFVSNIFAWTYEDTLVSDEKKGSNFSGLWCDAAKSQGYVYIVQIAGFGKEIKK